MGLSNGWGIGACGLNISREKQEKSFAKAIFQTRSVFTKITPDFLFLELGNCESEYHKRHGKIEITDCSYHQFNYEVSFFILQIPIGTYLDILLRLFRKLLYLKYLTKKKITWLFCIQHHIKEKILLNSRKRRYTLYMYIQKRQSYSTWHRVKYVVLYLCSICMNSKCSKSLTILCNPQLYVIMIPTLYVFLHKSLITK